MIKKIISVLTVLAICFGTLPTVASADYDYLEKSEFLSSFLEDGIFDGEDGAGVTRGKFVCDTVKMMECEIINDKYISFEDVSDGDVYAPYINTAAAYGFVSDGKKFFAENIITLPEAVKILSCAFGYDKIAEQNGGYPDGFLKYASGNGLLNGVNAREDGTLTTENVKTLVYNYLFGKAIEQDTLKITDENKVKYNYKRNGETNLEKFFDVYEVEGVVTETSYSSLVLNGSIREDNIIAVNGTVYDSDLMSEDFLGLNVKAYYKDNNGGRNKIIALLPYNNTEFTVDAEDYDEISGNVFKYEADGKEKRATLEQTVVYIYNGRRVNLLPADAFDGDFCEIRLVDNNANGRYDVMFVNNYKYYKVASADYSSGVIGLEGYGKVDILPEGKLFCFDADGNFADASVLKEGDITAFKISDDKELVTLIICTDEISGVVEEYAPGDKKIVVNGTEYSTVKNFEDIIGKKVSLGNTATFAVGVDGKIVMLKDSPKGYKYGYIVYADFDDGKSKDAVYARILTASGDFVSFDIADDVYLDNVKTKKGKLKEKLNETGYPYSLIKYKTDSAGNIKYIDTPVSYADGISRNENDTLVKYVYSDTLYYRSSPEVLVPKANVSGAAMFYAPKTYGGNEEDLCVIFKGDLINNTKYTAEIYDIADDGTAGAVVFRTEDVKTKWGSQHASVMVDRVTNGLNADGDMVKKLYCWRSGALVCYDVDDGISLEKSSGKTVSKGDVMRVRLGKDNVIEMLTPDVDASGSEIIIDAKSSGQKNVFATGFSYIFGYVYSTGVNTLIVSDTPINSTDTLPSEANIIPLSTSVKILRYCKKDNTITPTDIGGIHTSKGMGAAADFAVIRTASDIGYDVFIYE